MKQFLIAIFCAIIISSCTQAPRDTDIQTAIAETNSALPTSTYTITIIPSSTNTLLPTNTSTSTKTTTPTETLTPTKTNTATPLPPATLTQQAIEATQTERAAIATSTQVARDEHSTSTAVVRTKTASVYNATATEIASYEEIYWEEFINYSHNYIGQKLVVRGRVFNIEENYIQIWIAGTYEAVIVRFKEPIGGIYEDDSITVYGIVSEKECGINAYGGTICHPALSNAWFTKP